MDEPAVYDPRRTCRAVRRQAAQKPVSLVGDGVRRYGAELSTIACANLLPNYTTASALVALELGAARAPEESVAPMYLRDADAVANFTTRQRQPSDWIIRTAERRDVSDILQIEIAQFSPNRGRGP